MRIVPRAAAVETMAAEPGATAVRAVPHGADGVRRRELRLLCYPGRNTCIRCDRCRYLHTDPS